MAETIQVRRWNLAAAISRDPNADPLDKYPNKMLIAFGPAKLRYLDQFLSKNDAAPNNPLVARFLKRRPIPGEELEAELRWGQPSAFPGSSADHSGGGVNIISSDGGATQNQAGNVRTYTEVNKTTQNYRVENPEDESQYVIVQRRTASLFQRDDGALIAFEWDNEDLPGTAV